MKLTRLMCPQSKWNIKCPYEIEAEECVVHNSANKASALAEISYMIGNNNEVSYHYAIDDTQIVQGIEENRNTWNAGDGSKGRGNRKAISYEICHSTNPDSNKFIEAEKLAAKFIAYKLKEKGWGVEKVKKHQDYSKKYCPHKTLDLGWKRFLKMIQTELDTLNKTKKETTATTSTKKEETKTTTSTKKKIDVKYQTYTNGRWQPNVKNTEDYAGVLGMAVTGIYANLSQGDIIYKVHTKNGKWLPAVTNRKDYAGILGQPIDAVMIRSTKGTARYRVHIKNGNWLDWVTGYSTKDANNGYAGILGKSIDAIQIEII